MMISRFRSAATACSCFRGGPAAAALLVVALGVTASCGGGSDGRLSTSDPALILVAVDGLRADALGCSGGPAGATPAIDSLAAEAVRFEWAFAQSSGSAATWASLLTALYPTTHGVLAADDELAAEAVTIAEAATAAGFTTALFTDEQPPAGVVGAAQGFSVRQAGGAGGAAEWLRGAGDGRFVLVLHTAVAANEAGPEEQTAAYRDAVATADARVAELLVALRELGLDRRTVIALVGLRGRELGEHHRPTEASLYAPVTRVPMMVRLPSDPRPAVVDNFVEAIDLAPTVLELLGVTVPAGVQGSSLLPLVRGEGQPPYVAFGESEHDGGQRFAALAGYRLLVDGISGGEQLFHVARDPLELEDVAALDDSQPALRRMRSDLEAWGKMVAAASLDPERRSEELDEGTLEQLKSLGYVQ